MSINFCTYMGFMDDFGEYVADWQEYHEPRLMWCLVNNIPEPQFIIRFT